MRFKRSTKPGFDLDQINIVALTNVIFLVLILFMFLSAFAVPSGISVKLPRTMTSDIIKEENVVITVSGEDIIYLNNLIVTIPELTGQLEHSTLKSQSILIKADRRSSVGRIIDVWNLCRSLGIEGINIATNQEK